MEKEKKEKDKTKLKKKKDTRVKFVDFLIPIVSFIIFLLVLFFSVIPTISRIVEMYEKIEDLERKQGVVQKKISDIDSIDLLALEEDLRITRHVVPPSLEIAEYAYYIEQLALEKNLRIGGISASGVLERFRADDDGIDEIEDKSVIDNMHIARAEIENITGDFDDIVAFYDELQTYSPYILSFGSALELSGPPGGFWNFEIEVLGYYYPAVSADISRRLAVAGPFIPYSAGNEETTSLFRDKSRRILTPEDVEEDDDENNVGMRER